MALRRLSPARNLMVLPALALLVLTVVAAILLLRQGSLSIRVLLQQHGPLVSYVLLYIEESGIPLPLPGDVFVMYVGLHVPHHPLVWFAAWLGLVGCVVAGATNLYLVSREWGRRLVTGRVGAVIHLTPEGLARAERWFQRWGPLAIIFGRHVPGFRVPITVVSGLLRVSYVVFALCVAVSTGVWAAIFMFVGVTFGANVESFLRHHRVTYITIPVLLIALFSGYIAYRLRRWQQEQKEAAEAASQ